MDFLQVILTACGSVAVLFLICKLIGNKQVSQMSMFDYINGITIGSIAAELATLPEREFYRPLIAMVIYGLVTFGINIWTQKSVKIRNFFDGKSYTLLKGNRLIKENFKKARLNLDDFLLECRVQGYFDLNDIAAALSEPNGKISILPKNESQPATKKELQMPSPPDATPVILIKDGKVLDDALKHSGKDLQWLDKQLHAQHVKTEEVFLAYCDAQEQLQVF